MKKNQLYPTDLTDSQWDCIKELIPPAKPGGHPRILDMRNVVNAIFYLVVTGCPWQMLPREDPAWQSVKTTQVSGVRGDDAGKKVNGRNRHILMDTLGLLLAVVVTSAAVSDPAGARLLFRHLGGACKKVRRIWVDGTSRGHLLEWVMLPFHARLATGATLR